MNDDNLKQLKLNIEYQLKTKRWSRVQRKKIRGLLNPKRCRYCRSEENLTIDHKIPLIQGGTNDVKNLQILCNRCNTIKSGLSHKQVRNIWKWFTEIQEARTAKGKKPYFLKKEKVDN